MPISSCSSSSSFSTSRLHGDVERGGRLVGDQDVGLQRERHGDHDALALAAGELVRILVASTLPARGCRRGASARARARAASAPATPWTRMISRDLPADGVDRVEVAERVLEDHGDALAVDRAGARRRDMSSRSRPSNRISPEVISPGGMSIRFMIAEADTDLPEPLSPRMASVSPRSRCQLTSLTASTMPRGGVELGPRGCGLRAGDGQPFLRASDFQPPALGGVERDAQPARQEVERQRGQDDREAGPEGEPPGVGEILLALRDHQAPGDLRRLDADAEEGQRAFRQHDEGEVERRDGDQRRDDHRQDVPEDDAPVTRRP